jgi:serine/threonine-protein kinase
MTQTELQQRGTASLARPKGTVDPHRLGPWRVAGPEVVGRFARVLPASPADGPEAARPCYALKLLRPPWHENAAAVQRLAREAMVGRLIRHAHVVPVLTANVTAPPFYLVMPWLAGTTLGHQLGEGRSFSIPEALWIARQAASGLGGLHQAGYVHGDVKPENIFVSSDGHVTLIDLGFAHRPDETHTEAERTILGTREFLAPEWRAAGSRADIRADIFSLGLVLAELLLSGNAMQSGRPRLPHEERSSAAVATIRSMIGLPDGLKSLVRQMLAREPLRRPQTPAEVVRRLTALEIATFTQRASW